MYNRDSLNALKIDSLGDKRKLLSTQALFGYFEKSINNTDSITVIAPSSLALSNVKVEFNEQAIIANGVKNTSSSSLGSIRSNYYCEYEVIITIRYELRETSYQSVWVPVVDAYNIGITCTDDGGIGSPDPNASSNWWDYGTG